jgi:hypothetical protein
MPVTNERTFCFFASQISESFQLGWCFCQWPMKVHFALSLRNVAFNQITFSHQAVFIGHWQPDSYRVASGQ